MTEQRNPAIADGESRAPAVPLVGVAIVSYNSAGVLPDCLASLRQQGAGVRLRTVVVDNGSRDGTPALIRRDFPEVLVIEAPRNGGFSYGTNLGLRALGLLGPRGREEDALSPLPSPPALSLWERGPAASFLPSPRGRGAGGEGRYPLPLGEARREILLASRGVRAAACDYVLFLNPDTVLPPDALAPLVALLAARPELGAVGPRLVRADGSLDRACRRGFPTAWNAFCHYAGLARRWPQRRLFGGYNLTYLPETQPAAVDALAGAFMLVRAEAARQVGAWDERFFAYGEDLDYCLRLHRLGWGVWYEPSVRVLHLKGTHSQQRSLPMLREFYRAMLLYYAKHHAPHHAWPLRLAVLLGVRLLYVVELLRQLARPANQRWVGGARAVARR